MNIQTIEDLGYEILITEYITKDVQRRTHKKKRINKKWLKRYGMKIVPDNTKILLVNNTLMMTGKCYEKLRKLLLESIREYVILNESEGGGKI